MRPPLLSPTYEDPAAAREVLAAAYAADDASGSVAIDGSRVVGYLLGAPKGGSAWGANVWVESAGHAVEEPEPARTLYAVAATRWLDEGRAAHYALCRPTTPHWCRPGSAWLSAGSTPTRSASRRRPARCATGSSYASRSRPRSRSWPGSTWC